MILKQMKTSGGIKIYSYVPTGESVKDPVIILAGGPGISSQLYRHYLKDLCPQRRIIFWDYASTGQSDLKSDNTFANDFNDLNQVVETLDLQRFSLLAHSYGGALAIKMAEENSNYVKSLCLVCTSDYFLPVLKELPSRKASKLSPQDFEKLIKIYERLLTDSLLPDDLSKFCELEAQSHFLNVTSEQKTLFLNESGLNLTVLATNQDWIPLNFQPQLSKIVAKTLVVTSKNDIIVPPQFSKNLVAQIPKARIKEFNFSGHWPFIEEPKKFFDIVGDFFAT